MNTAGAHKEKTFIITAKTTSSKFNPDLTLFSLANRKSAISSNPKSTQKQNESTFFYIPTENTIIIDNF